MATMKATKRVTAEQYQAALDNYVSNGNKIAEQTAKYNTQLEALSKKYTPIVTELADEQKKHEEIVQQYAEQNRSALFGKQKSIEVQGVKIGFQLSKAKVELATEATDKDTAEGLWANALKLMKKLLPDHVRTVEEISKAKILEDKEQPKVVKALAKCGLKIAQEESFYIKPVKAKN